MTVPQLSTLTPWGWAAAALAGLAIVAAAWWLLTEPGRQRAVAAGARGEAALATARSQAAGQAAAILEAGSVRDAATDMLTQETADAIRSAPGADQRLDPRLNAAGLQRVCQRAAYMGRPECLQLPRAQVPPDSGPGR